VQKRGNEHAQ
jgi:hypothetical protein